MATGSVGNEGRPRLIAHRGFAQTFPENTLPAVRGAIERGASMVEVDCRRCASGEIVVFHDETVDRVTEASGRVADLPAADLESLNVLESGAGVPTLRTVVDAVPTGVGLNVELKERGIAEDVLAAVADVEAEVIVSAFDTQALAEAAQAGDRPLALLVDRRPRSAVRRAVAADCAYVHPKAGLCLRSMLIRRAHRAGLGVNAWTIRSRRMARWLTRLGVDGLIADTPAVR
jgi:glycerophosphoryl diester phosphodiesterase